MGYYQLQTVGRPNEIALLHVKGVANMSRIAANHLLDSPRGCLRFCNGIFVHSLSVCVSHPPAVSSNSMHGVPWFREQCFVSHRDRLLSV